MCLKIVKTLQLHVVQSLHQACLCLCRLEHYWKVYDIQTVALLSCVFHMYDRRARRAMAEKGVQLLTSPRSHPYKALSSGSRNTVSKNCSHVNITLFTHTTLEPCFIL